MELINTLLQDVQVIKSPVFYDESGDFLKLFNQQASILEKYEINDLHACGVVVWAF